MKLIRRLVFVLVLLVILAVVGMFYADSLAKTGIEAGGTKALGVETTVEKCSVGFLSSTFGMTGLNIANPSGFGDDSFLKLGEGSVEVSARSLLSDKIKLPALELSGIRVNLVHGTSGSNYSKIMDNLEKLQGDTKDDSEGKRFVIERLVVKDVLVKVVPMQGLFAEVSIPIDKIELKDVGSEGDKGVLLSELAGILVTQILNRASLSVDMPGMVAGALKGQLGQLGNLTKLGGVIGDVTKTLDDEVKKGLKGITDKIPGIGK